ncbi:MAG: ribbon-helix-helix domain-containing protein [Candidatus Krumholzibacteriia bacterium]
MASQKSEIVTFKADRALLQAMQGLPNRSEFIRAAVLAALDSACPLCRGTGILSAQQREHWSTFARSHSVQECDDCHEWHLVCGQGTDRETNDDLTPG